MEFMFYALLVVLSISLNDAIELVNPDGQQSTQIASGDLESIGAGLSVFEEHILSAIVEQTKNASIGVDCRTDLETIYKGIQLRQPWAIAMYDASVKVPTGVEHGAVYQFGNYDQCLSASTQETTASSGGPPMVRRSVLPKYCLADVTMSGYSVRTGATRHFELQNQTVIYWGVCVPATCQRSDVARLLSAWTGQHEVSVSQRKCHTLEDSRTFTAVEVFYACVIIAMCSMVLLCSGFHVYLYATSSIRGTRRGVVEQIIMSFSLIENVQKLGQESRDEMGLAAINGIKAMSMIFIIAGHALLFMVGGPILNADFYAKEIHMVQNAFLLNSPLLVDTFLLLSGFLFAHLLLAELEKRNGQVNFLVVYMFRYIRLTPAYLAVIALYATWLPRLGSGPLWQSRMHLEQERCQASWWINLLYINNYMGTDQICMFQSWYLAADTQLFILAPLVLYPIWRSRKMGLSLLASLTVLSIVVPFVTTLVNDTDPSFLPYADEIVDISANQFFVNTYIKTHMRATSFLFGIMCGYLVHYIKEKKIKFSTTSLWLLWTTTIVIGVASMFSIVVFFGVEYSPVVRSLYASLHRLGWSYATSWVLLACVLGYAGPLRSFLASRALVPLSRLTYCAYLMNGLVELYQAASIRAPKHMSIINLIGETSSHILITFLGALLLCLVFESPIHGIEKIFLRKDAHQPQRRSDSSLDATAETDSESWNCK